MKKVFLALLCMACLSCGQEDKVPEGILPEAKMVDILVDIHIAEGRVSIKNMPVDSSRKYFTYFKNKIFQEAGIDSAVFNKSYQYYAANVEKLDKIYTSVIDSLSVREAMKKVD